MILRRIKAHVEKENWFAVGIDFCIVVIGVFIGIQVANWNDAQTNSAREQEILADLLSDLNADRAALSGSLQLATLGVDAGNMLLIGAGTQPVQSVSIPIQSAIFGSDVVNVELPPVPSKAIRNELWKHSIVRLYPSHNDATIESLIAADKSAIIENTSLVRDLVRYRTMWTGLEDAQVNTYRPIRDRMMFVGQEQGFSPLTPIEFDVLTDALRTDPALRGALRTMVEYSITQEAFYSQIHKQAEALAQRVEAELDK